MYADQSSHAADARPSRERRPPAWFADYTVSHPNYNQHPPPAQSVPYLVGTQERDYGAERSAGMVPLDLQSPIQQWAEDASAALRNPSQPVPFRPQYQSSPATTSAPAPEATSVILEAIKQLQEDNQRLHLTVIHMQRQLSTSAPGPVLHHSAPPRPPTRDRSPLLPPPPLQHSSMQYHVLKEEDDWPPPPPTPPLLQRSSPQYGQPKEEQDYFPPPPPPPEYVVQRPAPAAVAHSNMVEELTEHMKRMGKTPHGHGVPTAEYCEPYEGSESNSVFSIPATRRESVALQQNFRGDQQERVYRGPKPKIPHFTKADPREFPRLKIALENLLPADVTERFKYQILVDHLKFEEALLIADSYTNSRQPYSDTMATLTEHYGQPHQLALRRIAELMEASSIRTNDAGAFKKFALRVRALVGMLDQLGDSGNIELQCGSHVTRLLQKLPQDMREEFKRYLYPSAS